MTQRINERIFGQAGIDRAERLRRSHQTGEYIDEHTTATDKRPSEEVLDREPKCCVKYIPLTQGLFAIVDYKNYDKLMKHKWCVMKNHNTYYAVRGIHNEQGKYKTLLMHQEILPPPKGMETDHKNHNGLDNREYNLRHCSRSQNQHNQQARLTGTSKLKGVYWCKIAKKWRAQIKHNNKQIRLGFFDNEVEAGKAYDKKANELFGEFACLNFPKEEKANVGRNKKTDQGEAKPV